HLAGDLLQCRILRYALEARRAARAALQKHDPVDPALRCNADAGELTERHLDGDLPVRPHVRNPPGELREMPRSIIAETDLVWTADCNPIAAFVQKPRSIVRHVRETGPGARKSERALSRVRRAAQEQPPTVANHARSMNRRNVP